MSQKSIAINENNLPQIFLSDFIYCNKINSAVITLWDILIITEVISVK